MQGIKKHIALFFVPIVLVSSINLPLVYLEFELNKGYITKVLCVDRDKPVNICSGSCFLKKRLEKESRNNTRPNSKTKRFAFTMFFQGIKKVFIPKYDQGARFAIDNLVYSFMFSEGIFRPPNFQSA